jgi:hypothetical protein
MLIEYPAEAADFQERKIRREAPVGGFANRLPRRAFLVSMDLTRAAVAVALPFVDRVRQVYVLIFVLQAASAAFTPTFLATIPDVLPDENEYTRALSLSRLDTTWRALLSHARGRPARGRHIQLALRRYDRRLPLLGRAGGVRNGAAIEASGRGDGIYDNTMRGIRIDLGTPRLLAQPVLGRIGTR